MSYGFFPISTGAIADIPMGRSALIVVGVTAVSALGTVSTTATQAATLIGFSMTAALGTGFATNGKLSHTTTGVTATGALGVLTVTGKAGHALTGVTATGALGAAVFNLPNAATASSLAATASIGTPSTAAAASVQLGTADGGGLSATGRLGAFITSGGVLVDAAGVAATGVVGALPTISNFVDVVLDGLISTLSLGTVEAVDMSPWKPIVPTGASSWVNITTTV